ncbi:hypothetical protein C8R44DRAFT_759875 [Mycena epipterygia]|nr:hypothetical protein C8R44DRAFT_759875 [Mycena epipterygia]
MQTWMGTTESRAATRVVRSKSVAVCQPHWTGTRGLRYMEAKVATEARPVEAAVLGVLAREIKSKFTSPAAKLPSTFTMEV